MKTRKRGGWGKMIRLTGELAAGRTGTPAIALRPPFGVWVASGMRKYKYLKFSPGSHWLFYLYQSSKKSPQEWLETDIDDEYFRAKKLDLQKAERVIMERAARDSEIKSAIVGLASLQCYDPEMEMWSFDGGVLLREPIPLDDLTGRPMPKIFYPFGR